MQTSQKPPTINRPPVKPAQRSGANSIIPYIVSALAGFLVCFIITVVTGKREAWDSEIYFSIGIPIMCLLIFFIAYKFPLNVWRWALAMALGQSLAISLAGNSLNLWPLSIIGMTIVSIPQLLVGLFAAKLSRNKHTS